MSIEDVLATAKEYLYDGQTATSCDARLDAPEVGMGDQYCTLEAEHKPADVHSWQGLVP